MEKSKLKGAALRHYEKLAAAIQEGYFDSPRSKVEVNAVLGLVDRIQKRYGEQFNTNVRSAVEALCEEQKIVPIYASLPSERWGAKLWHGEQGPVGRAYIRAGLTE